eukprot:6793322-Karenia_brevis.AAC.1
MPDGTGLRCIVVTDAGWHRSSFCIVVTDAGKTKSSLCRRDRCRMAQVFVVSSGPMPDGTGLRCIVVTDARWHRSSSRRRNRCRMAQVFVVSS